MFIRTFTAPNWPSDFAVSNHSLGDNCAEENYYDNHWDYMNRLPVAPFLFLLYSFSLKMSILVIILHEI